MFAARAVGAALVAALIFIVSVTAAVAQVEAARVHVDDAKTKKPIVLVRVMLIGPVTVMGFTDSSGTVRFADIPPGQYYARLAKVGFVFQKSEPFSLDGLHSTSIDSAMTRVQDLGTIGSVSVRTPPSLQTTAVTDTSPLGRLFLSASDALSSLPDLGESTAGGGLSGFSIDNHDASQTGLRMDGDPISGAGSASDTRLLNPDLYASTSVEPGSRTDGAAGSIHLTTLEPSLRWLTSVSGSLADSGKTFQKIATTGTVGNLGIAVVHADRSAASPIDGLAFADASGLSYDHRSTTRVSGDLAKLRFDRSTRDSITLLMSQSRLRDDASCLRFVGRVPCGYGPGGVTTGHRTSFVLSRSLKVGSVETKMGVSDSRDVVERDLRTRYVDLMPQPSFESFAVASHGAYVNVQTALGKRGVVGGSLRHSSVAITDRQNSQPATGRDSRDAANVFVAHDLGKAVTAVASVSLGRDSSGATRSFDLQTNYAPTRTDTYSFSAGLYRSAYGSSFAGLLTSPQNLQFDCTNGTALGSGPGDGLTSSRETTYRASYRHKTRRAQIALEAYSDSIRGGSLLLPVNGAALDPTSLPAGYLSSGGTVGSAAAGCPTSAPLPLDRLYIASDVSVDRLRYEGGTVSAAYALTAGLIVYPYWTVQSARILSDDPRFDVPRSIVVRGQQLPNAPLHRSGLVIAYRAPRSPLRAFSQVQHVDGNNAANLHAYTIASAAVALETKAVTVTLRATNLFNAVAGTFATSAYSQPLATFSGRPLNVAAVPLRSREISGSIAFRVGNRQPQRPAAVNDDGSGDTFENIDINEPAYVSDYPSKALEPDLSTPNCTRPAYQQAQTVFAYLRQLQIDAERAKIAGSYPASLSIDHAPPPTFTADFRGLSTEYAIVVRGDAIDALERCAVLHGGTRAEAENAKLYVPDERDNDEVLYQPKAGLYRIHYRVAGASVTEDVALQKRPVDAQFALTTTCPTNLRPAAQILVDELRYALAAGLPSKPLRTENWSGQVHRSERGDYLTLAVRDPAMVPTVPVCLLVANATRASAALGMIDGDLAPALNYRPDVGLYRLH